MHAVAAICLGACAGALLRWQLGLWLNHAGAWLPWGTLAANLVGGYLVGLAVALLHHNPGDAAASRNRGGPAGCDASDAPNVPHPRTPRAACSRGVRVSGRHPFPGPVLPATDFGQGFPAATRASPMGAAHR